MKILIVEDEEPIAKMIAMNLNVPITKPHSIYGFWPVRRIYSDSVWY